MKSLCGSFCIACLPPLTRRYAEMVSIEQDRSIIKSYAIWFILLMV
ncbi:hypothetical protein P3711_24145 [Vibrio parahaemolyticus]|nr:hypothetical protein [Vibrio parahaemolyticus]MCX8941133.1 hypothetical protein [Vibrio parahaemolyticus]MDF5490388.1 hypothetical protein [Vibrio parahaemolyticus]MDF5533221.1 hypothetical protein [Vibrio parahaemolyticus]MDF5549306.1 hypothetical protein [Vibrio parahaemolyticus]MDF5601517.1 hypothetical protein [Vibrio parahaemolyticus]